MAELLLDKGYEVWGVIRRSSSFNTGRVEHIYRDLHEQGARLKLKYGDLNDASSLSTHPRRSSYSFCSPCESARRRAYRTLPRQTYRAVVVSWGSGRTDLVARAGGQIWIDTYSNGWSGWGPIGAPAAGVASSPSITSWGTDRLDVFVRGGDDQLYVRSYTGTWTPSWSVIGPEGVFRGKPSAVSRGQGLIDIFVHGMGSTPAAADAEEATPRAQLEEPRVHVDGNLGHDA